MMTDWSRLMDRWERDEWPRWVIGLPGWRFYLGRDYYHGGGSGILLHWVWRHRLNPKDGELRYCFEVMIRFGRSRESVIDFGGPCWCPWPISRQIDDPFWADAYSRHWTGRTTGWVGIDWPRLSFSFYRIPE